jgi:hypothetical protein
MPCSEDAAHAARLHASNAVSYRASKAARRLSSFGTLRRRSTISAMPEEEQAEPPGDEEERPGEAADGTDSASGAGDQPANTSVYKKA